METIYIEMQDKDQKDKILENLLDILSNQLDEVTLHFKNNTTIKISLKCKIQEIE